MATPYQNVVAVGQALSDELATFLATGFLGPSYGKDAQSFDKPAYIEKLQKLISDNADLQAQLAPYEFRTTMGGSVWPWWGC